MMVSNLKRILIYQIRNTSHEIIEKKPKHISYAAVLSEFPSFFFFSLHTSVLVKKN